MDLYLAKPAFYFTTFENLPEGWSAWGGGWSIAAGAGRRNINVLQGEDDDKGPGKVSLYHRGLPLSVRYVAVQVQSESNQERFGLALLNSISSPVTIFSANLDYTGKNKGFAIERFYNEGWETIQQSKFTPVKGTW